MNCKLNTLVQITEYPELLDLLKAKTARQHAQLERLETLRKLLSDNLTWEEYGNILSRLLCVIHPLENALLQSCHNIAGLYGYRTRTPDLLEDLIFLGIASRYPDIRIPRSILSTGSTEIGCLYVLEGSRFGSKIIAKRISEILGLSSHRGLLFFTNGGLNIDRDWRRFNKLAEAFCQSASSRENAVFSACVTFDLFKKGLS